VRRFFVSGWYKKYQTYKKKRSHFVDVDRLAMVRKMVSDVGRLQGGGKSRGGKSTKPSGLNMSIPSRHWAERARRVCGGWRRVRGESGSGVGRE
jgi:hypothetical protein